MLLFCIIIAYKLMNDLIDNVTSAAGCPDSGTEAMTCLRAAPLSTLIKSINNVRTNFLAPTIDGPDGFLPDLPSRLITQGKFQHEIDLIAGHTTNDGRNFAGNPKNVNTDADIITAILNRYRHMVRTTYQGERILLVDNKLPNTRQKTHWRRFCSFIPPQMCLGHRSWTTTIELGQSCRTRYLDACEYSSY